jgi:hypothetical protein
LPIIVAVPPGWQEDINGSTALEVAEVACYQVRLNMECNTQTESVDFQLRLASGKDISAAPYFLQVWRSCNSE